MAKLNRFVFIAVLFLSAVSPLRAMEKASFSRSLIAAFRLIKPEKISRRDSFAPVFDNLKLVIKEAHPQTKEIFSTKIAGINRPFAATNSLTISGSGIFYFTNILKAPLGDHDLVIMFAKNDTQMYVPRLLYKSLSGGSWRVAPETVFDVQQEQAIFSKGFGIHYTQETKPVEEIINHLERIDQFKSLNFYLTADQFEMIYRIFVDEFFFNVSKNSGRESVFSYDKEVKIYEPLRDALRPLQNCQPGTCFGKVSSSGLAEEAASNVELHNSRTALSFYNQLRDVEYPDDFLPNFYVPALRAYKFTHSLLGLISVQVFLGKLDGKNIEWHFAYDQKGRIWIDRIYFAERKINSYGLVNTVIDSGFLTNKPLEYSGQCCLLWEVDQTDGLSEREMVKPFHDAAQMGGYHDLSPLLNRIRPIKDFRLSRMIFAQF